jgi:hypothetical protein
MYRSFQKDERQSEGEDEELNAAPLDQGDHHSLLAET